jgi:hypothetical protein
MVYVGWCSKPIVALGTAAPSKKFLDEFDRHTGVYEVTKKIVTPTSVSKVTIWNLP